MRIQSVQLENFRGFNNLKLQFFEDLNVIIGENGSGKSSVLDAIAILLSHFIVEINESSMEIKLTDEDIKNETNQTKISIDVSKNRTQARWYVSKSLGKKENEDKNSNKKETIRSLFRNDNNVLPLIVYYRVNRVADVNKSFQEKLKPLLLDSPLQIYEESLNTKTNFREFFDWFKEREDYENEQRLDNNEAWRDAQLEAVRRAIMEQTGFFDLRMRRNPLRLEVSKGTQRLNVNQLSDGEKCMLAMVGDLARRFSIANPVMQNPLEGRGIVLIDEVELHLHPAWQRQIIPGLRKTFPNCQFIVTTHSPQVISHVEPEKIFILRQSGNGVTVSKAEEAYGKNTDRILEDLMGVPARPTEIANQLDEVFRLIDQRQFAVAKELVVSLRDKIGDDAELLKAEVLIQRKEIIGK